MAPTPAFEGLSLLSAHLLALSFSSSYVGVLYVVGKIQPGSRDDPRVIRARLMAVTVTSALSCGAMYALVARSNTTASPLRSTLAVLGAAWSNKLLLSCLHALLLFLGPMYGNFLCLSLPGQSVPTLGSALKCAFGTLIGFRNYVWGPLTEEIVFRGCVLSVYAMAGAGRGKMIGFAPLVFGLAHVHHAWETFTRLGRTKQAFQNAMAGAVFQTAYTTLFGAYASFLFLRTSSLIPPLVAHVFCNYMGLPQIAWELRRFPEKKTYISAAYALGILAFAYTMGSWTGLGGSGLYWTEPSKFWGLVGS